MKRWLALLASMIIQSCLGVVYAWSTFVPALKKEYGIHEGRSGLIFGVCIATFTVVMVFGGCFVLFAAQTAEFFGAHRISEVYPFVFLGYGIAGLTAPAAGGWMLHVSGSPALATVSVAAVAVAAAVISKLFRPQTAAVTPNKEN